MRTSRRAPARVVRLTIGLLIGISLPAVGQEPAIERVVSVVPAATEMMFAMGAGDLMVAVGSYDRWPPEVEDLPRIGAYLDPDVERILALRTDLAIIDAGQTGLARRLENAGIRVYPYEHGGVSGALAAMRELGAVVGRPAAGETLARRVEQELEALGLRFADRERPRTLLVFGRNASFGEMWVVGSGQFLDELLEIAGGRNVFGDVDRLSFKAGLETVLARRPDVVLEAAGDLSGAAREAARRAAEEEWRALPGFADVRVALLPAHALVPGPRMVETAVAIAHALHGPEPVDLRRDE